MVLRLGYGRQGPASPRRSAGQALEQGVAPAAGPVWPPVEGTVARPDRPPHVRVAGGTPDGVPPATLCCGHRPGLAADEGDGAVGLAQGGPADRVQQAASEPGPATYPHHQELAVTAGLDEGPAGSALRPTAAQGDVRVPLAQLGQGLGEREVLVVRRPRRHRTRRTALWRRRPQMHGHQVGSPATRPRRRRIRRLHGVSTCRGRRAARGRPGSACRAPPAADRTRVRTGARRGSRRAGCRALGCRCFRRRSGTRGATPPTARSRVLRQGPRARSARPVRRCAHTARPLPVHHSTMHVLRSCSHPTRDSGRCAPAGQPMTCISSRPTPSRSACRAATSTTARLDREPSTPTTTGPLITVHPSPGTLPGRKRRFTGLQTRAAPGTPTGAGRTHRHTDRSPPADQLARGVPA
jgi:hypothetical protein